MRLRCRIAGSLAFLTVFDLGPVAAVQAAAAAGYDLIGLRLLPAAPTEGAYALMTIDAVLAGDRRGAEGHRRRRRRRGDRPLKAETDVADFTPFFARAERLGARNVLVAGDDPEEARLTGRFAALVLRLAAGSGLTVDLEAMP